MYMRLMKTLFLLNAVVNCEPYKEANVFLLFTGLEKLQESLKSDPLSGHFKDYNRGNNAEAAYEYILGLFYQVNIPRVAIHPAIVFLEESGELNLNPVLARLAKIISSKSENDRLDHHTAGIPTPQPSSPQHLSWIENGHQAIHHAGRIGIAI